MKTLKNPLGESWRSPGTLLCCLALALVGTACSDTPAAESDFSSTAESALTAAQCSFFAVNDRVSICHRTGAKKKPFERIRTNLASCGGHTGHVGDYVAYDDLDCNGAGCFPVGAPFDGTVECCPGLVVVAGKCADVDECRTNNGECGANALCTNTVGSHTCACAPGFLKLDGRHDGRDGDDGDDDDDRDHDGDAHDHERHESGRCGHFHGALSCVDVDECATNNGGCGAGATCTNNVGAPPTCTTPDLCAHVTCPASDPCHEAGTCDPSTGACSNPASADGTACNDGDACTQADSCEAGACVGSDPVVCSASDQCHDAGVCEPETGACSHPPKDDFTFCDDLDANTVNDVCLAGGCSGVDHCLGVTCVAIDQCHVAGACVDHATGACSDPSKADATACDDANPDTSSDACTSGVCAGVDLCLGVTCRASDQCHLAGVCDHATGACSNPAKADGVACNDGNGCNLTDTCAAGTCVGAGTLCENGASCSSSGGTATCGCATGWTGPTCADDVNECLVNNGGCDTRKTCTNTAGGFSCGPCPSGWATVGDACVACTAVQGCVSSLTCTTPSGSQCTACADGTYLSSVGQASSCPACAPIANCASALTCTGAMNAQCDACEPGFTLVDGVVDTCVPADPCASQPCLNGGTCASGTSGFICTCAGAYTGTNCEVASSTCALVNGSFEQAGTPYATSLGGLSSSPGWTNLSGLNIQASTMSGGQEGVSGATTGTHVLRLVADANGDPAYDAFNLGAIAQQVAAMRSGEVYTVRADALGGFGSNATFGATLAFTSEATQHPSRFYAQQVVDGLTPGEVRPDAFALSYTATAADEGKPLFVWLQAKQLVGLAATRGAVDNVRLTCGLDAPQVFAQATPSIAGATADVNALLLDASGAPIAGALISFSISSGAMQDAVTDAQGRASAAFTAAAAGTYDVTVAYAGDANRLPASSATSWQVERAVTAVTAAAPSRALVWYENELSATLTRLSAPAGMIAQATIVFTITDSLGATTTLTAITDFMGVARVTFTPGRVGSHTVTASFAGDAVNAAASAATSFAARCDEWSWGATCLLSIGDNDCDPKYLICP